MYTTLDIVMVSILGGAGVLMYLACVKHYNELCAVKEVADELCELYTKSRLREKELHKIANDIAEDYQKALDREIETDELLMDCADALMAWHDEKERWEHNGWINRETWAFMLWQSGTAYMYDLMKELSAQIAVMQGIFEHEGDAEGNLSNRGMTDIEKRNLGAEYIKVWQDYADEMCREDGDFMLALQDIGSMWRVDPESVGNALEDTVREVLFDGHNIAIIADKDEYCELLHS